MDQARNIPTSTAAVGKKINVLFDHVVVNSRPGTSTANSNSSRTNADIPPPAVEEVVQDECKSPPTIHLSSQDYPYGDLDFEKVSLADLPLSWNARPIIINDEDDFEPKPKPVTPKGKVARSRPQREEGGSSSKRPRVQATKHNSTCKMSKKPCFGACDSELKSLLQLPIPTQQPSGDDSGQSVSISQIMTELEKEWATPISPLPLSGSLSAIVAEPVQQVAAIVAEPAIEAEPVQLKPAVERRTEAEPVQQAVKLSELDISLRKFDSLLERRRELGDVVQASAAKSLRLEAEKAEAERRVSELNQLLIAENSARSSTQSEMDDISAEIDRWRSAWARRM